MYLKNVIASIVLLFAVSTVFGQDSTQILRFSTESITFNTESLELENEIEVYPNPSVDYIIVNIKNSKLKETKSNADFFNSMNKPA